VATLPVLLLVPESTLRETLLGESCSGIAEPKGLQSAQCRAYRGYAHWPPDLLPLLEDAFCQVLHLEVEVSACPKDSLGAAALAGVVEAGALACHLGQAVPGDASGSSPSKMRRTQTLLFEALWWLSLPESHSLETQPLALRTAGELHLALLPARDRQPSPQVQRQGTWAALRQVAC